MKTLKIILLLLTGVCYAQPLTYKVAPPIRNFVQANPTSLVNEPNCVFAYTGSKLINGTLVDVSGTGNNGTQAGGTIYAGGTDGGLQFNGVSSKVEVASSSTLDLGTANFYVEFVSQLKKADADQVILGRYNGGANTGYTFETRATSVYEFYLRDGSATLVYNGATTDDLNKKIHWIITRNSGVATVYKNGVLVNTVAVAGDISSASQILRLGGRNSSWFLNGIIYQAKISTKGLSQAEVTAKWNAIAKTVYLYSNFSSDAVGSFPREWVKVSGTFAVTQISTPEGRLLKNDKYLLASAGGSFYTSATGNISNYYITYEFYTGGSWATKSGVVSTVSTAEASFDYSTTTNRLTFILGTNDRIAKIKITKGQTL